MDRLVFVSTGLFPCTPDAAGRVTSDLLRALDEADRHRATLVMVDAAVDRVSFEAAFPNVALVEVDTRIDQDRFADSRQHPPESAYSNTSAHWRSACVFRALSALSESQPIQYLEFQDAGGLAFCTLQESRLQGFLPDATIVVRLCGSHTALMHAEALPLSIEDLNLSDLERKCLRDCDFVIAPSPAVSEATREMFGFSPEEWEPRVVCHAPPVLSGDVTGVVHAVSPASDQAIVFSADLRRSERPDLFVRGVAGFMRQCPSYTGAMKLAGHCPDERYIAQIERLVPPMFSERASFTPELAPHAREALLGNATVVFPGASPACEMAAIEASLLGARVILNETNPAFGEGTRWRVGVNCLKFDGTVDGLVGALGRNFKDEAQLTPVHYAQEPWPWHVATRQRPLWRVLQERPLVSVVVPHHNLGSYLTATLDNLAAQSYQNIEIVVVDDASTDAQSLRVIDELAFKEDTRLKIARLTANVGLAAARNIGVRLATGRYVLTLDADDLIHPRFLEVGVAALENSAEFDIVVTPAGYFLDGEAEPTPGEAANFCDYAMFSGEAVVAGLLENRFSTATALFRKSALDDFPYVESLNCYEDWSLFMRMCDAGRRFLVTTDVFFFYRRRLNSMVHASRDLARKRIEYGDLLRTSAPQAIAQKSRHLLIGIGAAVAGNQAGAEPEVIEEPPDNTEATAEELIRGLFGPGGRYDEQVVFASLKASRWLERKVPWMIRGSMLAARWTWRAYRFVRGRR